MVKIARIEALELEIPFRFTFRHSLAERSQGHSILLRTEDEDGREGYGECVPRSYVTGETVASVLTALEKDLVPPFVGARFDSLADVAESLRDALPGLPRNRHAAFCALELSLLDLMGRASGHCVGEIVGPVVTPEVHYSGVVSADGLESSIVILKALQQLGFERVKIKVGMDPATDRAIIQSAREILGPHCGLRLDANGAWSPEEALGQLQDYEEFALEGVEQPLPAGDLGGLSWLTARSPVPVVLDESLASFEDAERLIDHRACHVFNIRISKCGGLINATRIRDLASEGGVRCQLGAQVGETALLSAAGRHFGTRSPDIDFLEGSFGTILLEGDIGTEDLTIQKGGRAPALRGPGLGVTVDPDRLAPYVSRRILLGSS